MATRTASPKPATKSTKRPTKRAAPRKTPARKTVAAGGANAGSAALATLRRNALPVAGALVAGAAAAAALFFTRRPNVLADGHPAPDLERDEHPGPKDRADPHFRPDIDAPMTAADRAALAPALDRPTLVAGSETDTAPPASRP